MGSMPRARQRAAEGGAETPTRVSHACFGFENSKITTCTYPTRVGHALLARQAHFQTVLGARYQFAESAHASLAAGEHLVFYLRTFEENSVGERTAILTSPPGAPRVDAFDPRLTAICRLDAEPRTLHLRLPDRVQIDFINQTDSIRVIEHRYGNVSLLTFGPYHEQLERQLLSLSDWNE
jgi:hypothetical protein